MSLRLMPRLKMRKPLSWGRSVSTTSPSGRDVPKNSTVLLLSRIVLAGKSAMAHWTEVARKEFRKPSSVISLVAVFFSACSLWVSTSILKNQLTQFAWGRLSIHMPGNTGSGPALSFLHERGEDLRFIDLRPFGQAYAADHDSEDNLARVLVRDMSRANLSDAWLGRTDFTNTDRKSVV